MTPTRIGLAGVLFLTVATLAAHGIGLRNGFAYDDEPLIRDNPVVTDPGVPIRDVVSSPLWRLEADHGVLWRPVTTLAFRAQWALGGGRPLLFHVVNLALAFGTAWAVALLLGRLGVDPRAALLAAVLFTVHPVHVEAVANGVGQAELWAALFVLAGLLAALRPVEGAGWAAGRIATVTACFLLGLGAKEIAVTLPALLVLLRLVEPAAGDADPGPGDRTDARFAARLARALRLDAPLHVAMAAGLVAYLVLRTWVLGGVIGEDPAPVFLGLGRLDRTWTALSVLPVAWGLLIAPVRLAADWDPGVLPVVPFPAVSGWLGLAVLGGLCALVGVGWRRGGRARLAAVGIAFVVVARLPVSNLVVTSGVLLAERTLFLPSVGMALVAAAVLHGRTGAGPGTVAAGRRVPVPVALAVLLAVTFTVRSAVRTPIWESTFTAMASLGRDAPASWRALRTLAVGRLNSGDTEGGLEAMGVAWETLPGRYDLSAEYGTALASAGRRERAREVLDWTVRTWPDRIDGLNLLAELDFGDGRYEEAWRVSREAIRRTGGNGRTWGTISEVHLAGGRLEAARATRRTSVALAPDDEASVARLREIEAALAAVRAAREAEGR